MKPIHGKDEGCFLQGCNSCGMIIAVLVAGIILLCAFSGHCG